MVVKFIQEEKKRQRYLILFLILVLVVTSFVVWWGFFREKKIVPSTIPIVPPREIKINFELLESPALKDLRPFTEVSPFTAELGRENPFIPY